MINKKQYRNNDMIQELMSHGFYNYENILPAIEMIGNVPAEEITFDEIRSISKMFGCSRFATDILSYLLNSKQYCGDHADSLYRNKKDIQRMALESNFIRHDMLFDCTYIDNLSLVPFSNKRIKIGFHYLDINVNSEVFRNIFVQYFHDNLTASKYFSQKRLPIFLSWISEINSHISNINDFNESMFWNLLNKTKTLQNKKDCEPMERGVLSLYRWLCNQIDYYAMDHAEYIHKNLLFSPAFLKYYREGYYFIYFDINNIPNGHDKIIFIFNNKYAKLSSRSIEGTWMAFNISSLNSNLYKTIILQYLMHLKTIPYSFGNGGISSAVFCFSKLEVLKHKANYENPNESYITSQETFYLSQCIRTKDNALASLNNIIGWIRRILEWAIKAKYISCDNTALDYLHQFEEPSKYYGNDISNDELGILFNALKRDSKKGLYEFEMYAICRLAIETEFRISTICHLRIDCIRPSFKPDRYKIYTSSKTSHGEKCDYEITISTYKLIKAVMDQNAELREKINIDMKNYLFVTERPKNRIKVINSDNVNHYIKSICKKEKLNNIYTVKNLRDTHMSMAVKYALENKKTDLEVSLLSKHKSIDTTNNHYVGEMLDEMLEASYQIIIGDLNYLKADEKIKDSIPKNLNDEAHTVEDGCGKCSLDSCYKFDHGLADSLPCFCCKNFTTTPAYINYFKRRIAETDRKLAKAVDPHDKEDLTTIKRICVAYLKAIYKHMESKGSDDNYERSTN